MDPELRRDVARAREAGRARRLFAGIMSTVSRIQKEPVRPSNSLLRGEVGRHLREKELQASRESRARAELAINLLKMRADGIETAKSPRTAALPHLIPQSPGSLQIKGSALRVVPAQAMDLDECMSPDMELQKEEWERGQMEAQRNEELKREREQALKEQREQEETLRREREQEAKRREEIKREREQEAKRREELKREREKMLKEQREREQQLKQREQQVRRKEQLLRQKEKLIREQEARDNEARRREAKELEARKREEDANLYRSEFAPKTSSRPVIDRQKLIEAGYLRTRESPEIVFLPKILSPADEKVIQQQLAAIR